MVCERDDASTVHDVKPAAGPVFRRTHDSNQRRKRERRSLGFLTSVFAPNKAPEDKSVKTMMNEDFAAMRSHRDRVHRYRRLLKTRPTGIEHQDLERRLCEERSAFDTLIACSFPLIFNIPHVADRERSVLVTAKDAIV